MPAKPKKFKLPTDKKVMEIIEWYKQEHKITMGDACVKLGVHPQVISPIRSGRQSFTMEHVASMVKVIKNLNTNYIFGLENNMTRSGKEQSALEALKAAVKMIEQKMK